MKDTIKTTDSGLFEQVAALIQAARQSVAHTANLAMVHTYFEVGRMIVEDEQAGQARAAAQNQWSLREMQRQMDTALFERLALSRDKESVLALAAEGQKMEHPKDLLKDPLVLEFLGLHEHPGYSEKQLEASIIEHLQFFLLELGKGFAFVGRQVRFTFEEDHFKVDLVFYNRLLRCFVIFDLKLGKLRHQDLGQMQMYVNYYDRKVKLPDENPTIGILLCGQRNQAVVELTLPADANIYASQYQLYLPDKALLQQKLADWIAEFEE